MKNFFIFITGAAMGSAVAWKLSKDYYEKIAQEEIDSVKEELIDKKIEPKEKETDITEQDKENYEKVLNQTNYSGYFKSSAPEPEEETNKIAPAERPYIISPDEYGEFEDYDQISFYYYADKVVADELDNIVEDVDDIIGLESLTHFGEYEDDSVFVRNDRLKADYEILLDHRNYSDVVEQDNGVYRQ